MILEKKKGKKVLSRVLYTWLIGILQVAQQTLDGTGMHVKMDIGKPEPVIIFNA